MLAGGEKQVPGRVLFVDQTDTLGRHAAASAFSWIGKSQRTTSVGLRRRVAAGEQRGVVDVEGGSVPGHCPRPLLDHERFEVIW